MTDISRGGTGLMAPQLPASWTERIEIAALPSAVRHARCWAADQLMNSDPPPDQDVIDSAALLVSELVTNAIRAVGTPEADQPQLSLLIKRHHQIVRIEVHDGAHGQVQLPCQNSTSAENGRGLLVIAALSTRWGWLPGDSGKIVWCELAV